MEYKNKRIGGLVTMVIGAILGKFFIFDVLQAAQEGQPLVTIFRIGIVASIICILLGLLYMLFGDKVEGILKFDPENFKLKNVAILLTLAGTGLAAFVWVNMELSKLGYN